MFAQEFKQEAVKLTKDSNQSIAKVAEKLGVAASAVSLWVNQDEDGGWYCWVRSAFNA